MMNIVLRFVGLGFLNEGNAPTVEAKTALSNYTNFMMSLPFMQMKIRQLSGEKRVLLY